MENNLYYTPTIEEFHIGFEYEEYQFLERNWKTVKCEFIKPNTTIDPKWFRVKYLDQSDIESLGWKWEILDTKTCIKMYIFKQYHLNIDFKQNKIAIYSDDIIKLFEGTIKNKSELIKLMQQLNIK